jgi:hypothetical protein
MQIYNGWIWTSGDYSYTWKVSFASPNPPATASISLSRVGVLDSGPATPVARAFIREVCFIEPLQLSCIFYPHSSNPNETRSAIYSANMASVTFEVETVGMHAYAIWMVFIHD